MTDDGNVVRQLTDNSNQDAYPVWSPDGSEITFVSDRTGNGDSIYVMNVDGTGVERCGF